MPLLLEINQKAELLFCTATLEQLNPKKKTLFKFAKPIIKNIYYIHQSTNSLVELINVKEQNNYDLSFQDYQFITDFTNYQMIKNWISNYEEKTHV